MSRNFVCIMTKPSCQSTTEYKFLKFRYHRLLIVFEFWNWFWPHWHHSWCREFCLLWYLTYKWLKGNASAGIGIWLIASRNLTGIWILFLYSNVYAVHVILLVHWILTGEKRFKTRQVLFEYQRPVVVSAFSFLTLLPLYTLTFKRCLVKSFLILWRGRVNSEIKQSSLSILKKKNKTNRAWNPLEDYFI